jgi:hypothetical protein
MLLPLFPSHVKRDGSDGGGQRLAMVTMVMVMMMVIHASERSWGASVEIQGGVLWPPPNTIAANALTLFYRSLLSS